MPPLIAALVCSVSAIVVVLVAPLPVAMSSISVRPVAEMMPWLALPVRPSGLPSASTICPAVTPDDWPNVAGGSDAPPDVTLITARSSGA